MKDESLNENWMNLADSSIFLLDKTHPQKVILLLETLSQDVTYYKDYAEQANDKEVAEIIRTTSAIFDKERKLSQLEIASYKLIHRKTGGHLFGRIKYD